jgi:hypothetical protein
MTALEHEKQVRCCVQAARPCHHGDTHYR